MIRNSFKICKLLSLYMLSGFIVSGFGQRLQPGINDGETFVLPGHVRPVIARGLAKDEGRVAGSYAMPRMSMFFAMTAAQKAELEQLLKSQQDRRSADYHRFLTPEQYATRFGMGVRDVEKVTKWLEGAGFSDVRVARSRTWISFAGTAGQAESAFHISLHRYSFKGAFYVANDQDLQLPKALAGMVEGVRGLHNFPMKPHLIGPHPRYTDSANFQHYLVPDDWATIYDLQPLYGAGFDGSGVTIAVVGQSDVQMTDIAAFRAAAGLPVKNPTVVIPPGDQDPGIQTATGDEAESDLDLEWSGGIAKNADILFITASATQGNGVVDSITYAIDNNVAPVMSSSYGECEADESASDFQTLNGLYAQANAQGMTLVASAGDAGATDCDTDTTETAAIHGLAVDFPASSAYVTGIGGTKFVNDQTLWNMTNNANGGSATSYLPEVVWNDGFQAATGGGASVLVGKPAWQSGSGVPADGARDVPDIAFAASPQYDPMLICGHDWCVNGFNNADGQLDVIGGTSAGPPPFAGALALIIQMHGAGTRLGNINPNLYSLAQISFDLVHDVVSGNNQQPCKQGTPDCPNGGLIGFSAGPGYDQTTGWGSLDVNNMAQQWFGDFQLSATPATVTLAPGSSSTADITVTPQNNFPGDVTFTCSVSSSLINVTCSVPATPVGPSGSVAVTITASNLAATPPASNRFRMPWRGSGLVFAVFPIGLIAFSTLPFALKKRPSPLCSLGSAMLLLIAAGAVSCGGGSSSSPSGPVRIAGSPPVNLECSLRDGTVGSPYSGSCVATGGSGTLTYSISSGALPPGLTLNTATGAVTGTPTGAGTSTAVIEASDSSSPAQTAVFATSFEIDPIELTLDCTGGQLGDIQIIVDTPYNGRGCKASGGTAPITYSISLGALPPGLTLNPTTGAIAGIATTTGYYPAIYVKATDSGQPAQTATQSTDGFHVELLPRLTLNCPFTGPPTVGVPFNSACVASGGTPPFNFSISSGVLPTGLVLNSSTGVISGTPTTALQVSQLVVTCTDSSSPAQVATASDVLDVQAAPGESGFVTITGTSGGVVNTVTIPVTVTPQ